MSVLNPPSRMDGMPPFDSGWVIGGERVPFLNYTDGAEVNWSEDLERLHEENSRDHFLDVWTRTAILERLQNLRADATIADLGCSTGYLLEDLARLYPAAALVGVDLVASGLLNAHALVPAARLVQADVCDLPVVDASVDAVASANLLEHVPDDRAALAETARILRPGAPAVFVVPAGPGTYDYYDRYLGHERRYARGELAAKAREAGLEVVDDVYLASLIYPAFWLVKQRNRLRYQHLEGEMLERRVASDIASTGDSNVGRMLWRLEEKLGLRLPFGIRNLVAARRPI
jgi:SAM-dependent methyltransferase